MTGSVARLSASSCMGMPGHRPRCTRQELLFVRKWPRRFIRGVRLGQLIEMFPNLKERNSNVCQ